MENKYLLRNKHYGTYYKSRILKGWFHYVADRSLATKLTKKELNKLLGELRHQENYEIVEV